MSLSRKGVVPEVIAFLALWVAYLIISGVTMVSLTGCGKQGRTISFKGPSGETASMTVNTNN